MKSIINILYTHTHTHTHTQIFQNSDLFDTGSDGESDSGAPTHACTPPQGSPSPDKDTKPRKERKPRSSSEAKVYLMPVLWHAGVWFSSQNKPTAAQITFSV